MRPPKRTTDCPDDDQGPKFDVQPPVRPAPKCDPPQEHPLPLYTYPTPTPPGAPLPEFPEPYRFDSPAVPVTCSDWPNTPPGAPDPLPLVSDSVETSAGRFHLFLYLQRLGLTSKELQHIRSVVGEDPAPSQALIEAGAEDPPEPGAVAALALLFNISEATAATITEACAEIKQRLWDMAHADAVARLKCAWLSVSKTYTCDEDGDGNAVEVVDYSTVTLAEGAFTSAYSQADADEKADKAAKAMLVCRWANDDTIVHCSQADSSKSDLDPGQDDLAQAPVEGAYPRIPVEALPAVLPLLGALPTPITAVTGPEHPSDPTRRRTNTGFTQAGRFSSLSSKAEAAAQAEAYALSQLDCFYLSSSLRVGCAPPASGEAAYTEIVPGVVYDGSSTGNPVDLPERVAASEISWEDANQAAAQLGETFLDCRWGNRPLIYSCDDKESDAGNSLEVGAHALPDSAYSATTKLANKQPVAIYVAAYSRAVNFYAIPEKSGSGYTASVPENSFFSPVSQEDADQQAALFALSSLSCVYCNQEVFSNCSDPASTTYTDEVSGVAYSFHVNGRPEKDSSGNQIYFADPVDPDNPDGDHTSLASNLAASARFCGADPFQVATAADLAGSVPRSVLSSYDTSCAYGNQAVYAACDVLTIRPFGGAIYDPSVDQSSYHALLTTPIGLTTDEAELSKLSSRSLPRSLSGTAGYVYVEPNTIKSSSQAEANAAAVGLAQAGLDCFWDSQRVVLYCGAPDKPGALTMERPVGAHADQLAAGSSGKAGDPVIVEARAYTSHSSQEEADLPAYLTAHAQLNCYWENAPVKLYCGAPALSDALGMTGPTIPEAESLAEGSTGGADTPVTVEAGTYTSYTSKEDADRQAYAAAYSQLNCYWENSPVKLYCGAPSVSGGATSMDGPVGPGADSLAEGSTGGADTPVTIEAGTYTSYNSKEDANRQAYIAAYVQLNCYWENSTVTLYCGAPASSEEVVMLAPIGEGADSLAEGSSGGANSPVTVSAGSYASYTSKEDADRQAYVAAYSQLNCYWENGHIKRYCNHGDAPKLDSVGTECTKILEESNPPTEVHYTRMRSFSFGYDIPAEVDAGVFVSYQSPEDAGRQAELLVLSMLECHWISAGITLYCDGPPLPEMLDSMSPCEESYQFGNAATLADENSSGSRFNPVRIQEGAFISSSGAVDASRTALLFAHSILSCFYANDKAEDSCAGGIQAGGPGTYSSLLPAGSMLSHVSKEEANTSASLVARALLHCVYTNAKVTERCPNGAQEGVGSMPDGPGVYSATIPEKTIYSYVSTDDATNTATLMALSLLVCVYTNVDVEEQCPNGAQEGVGSMPDGPGVYSSSVPWGTMYSSVSEADATYAATLLAISMLVCVYTNVEVEENCPHGPQTFGPGVYTASVPYGSIISYVSEADATGAAHLIALSLLVCAYTNSMATAACPGEGEIITSIVDGGVITSYNSPVAANATASLLAQAMLTCYATNQKATAKCPDDSVDDNGAPFQVTVPEGLISSSTSLADANATAQLLADAGLRCYFTNDTVTVTCEEELGYGAAGGPEIVEEETITSSISKADANNIATQLARASIDCYYTNDKVVAHCDGVTYDESGEMETGPGTYSATVEEGSIINYTSQEAANALAGDLASAMLDCTYTNAVVTAYCPVDSMSEEDADSVASFTVAAGSVTAGGSKAAANYMAYLLANAQLKCVHTNDVVTAYCPVDSMSEGDTPDGHFTVEAGAVASPVDKASANSMALMLANAQLKCPGKSGSLTFVSCGPDFEELYTLTWENGLITSSGEATVQAGCDGAPPEY